MVAFNVAILLIVVLASAYFCVSVYIWSLAIGFVLLATTLWGTINIWFLCLCWILYLFAILFANVKSFRQNYFTRPLMRLLQKKMPSISDTEREAIEAGNVWWEKDLFRGRPQWKKLLALPKPELSSEEQNFLDHQVETLCDMINDWQIVNEDHDLPKEVWDYLKQERFFGMIIAKKYGGLGFSALAHSTIVLKIATRSVSVAVNTMVPNSLGPGELLSHFGTEQQKDHYLPRLARGDEMPCFALTAPDAGSDAGSMTDQGTICYGEYEGKNILGIRLNWDKRYITLAPVATLVGIALRLYDPDHLFGDKVDIGITLCLISTHLPGIEIGHRHLPMHMAFMNGPIKGRNVFVPIDSIVGGTAMAGRGWHILMESLSIGRAISLPALSTASGKMIYRLTGGYARLRRQFNVPISAFEGIEEALGQIAGFTYMLESARTMTAGAVDQNVRPAIASAIAKYHMTEMARIITSHAMDIHAGHAIQMGPRNLLANAHCAVPISITVEGANILTRNLIIFGQGAIRCHPYLLQEINLLSSDNASQDVTAFDRVLLSHIGYTISNLTRSFWSGLTGGHLICVPRRRATARLYRQLSRMSSALGLLSDMAMLILGGDLKRRERTSARLGDILSQLYLASAVLKYFHDQGSPKTDLDYVTWCVEYCLSEIQVACDDLLNNFPNKIIGKLLRGLIFPWGRAYYQPNDQLCHRIVNQMLTPSAFRDRLTQFCYLSSQENDPLRRIENALLEVSKIDPLWKKFQNALRSGKVSPIGSTEERLQAAMQANVLTADEMATLLSFHRLYEEIIRVNEFTFDLRTIVT